MSISQSAPAQQDARWFSPKLVERWDELAIALRAPGQQPSIVIARMSLFHGSRYHHYDLKRRFMLSVLFKHWGTRFKTDARERLLKGAPDDWPRSAAEVGSFDDRERENLPFTEQVVRTALDSDTVCIDAAEKLLATCIEIAQPYVRGRESLFAKVEKQLTALYGEVCSAAIRSDLPLVIVDEAHNWKNGPSKGTNGFELFAERIAPRCRRALLLTATPFQLRPEEMLELLKVSDHMRPASTLAESKKRRDRLQQLRETEIAPVLRNSESASHAFSKAWKGLPSRVTSEAIGDAWHDPTVVAARASLLTLARERGVVDENKAVKAIDGGVVALDPDVRELVRRALRLYVCNHDLSNELGAFVVRHRRQVFHRAFLIGDEYPGGPAAVRSRVDKHVVHGSAGMDVRGEQEMPQYLLMRCISELNKGKGRTSLGTALTGCYSTLLHSADGKTIRAKLDKSPLGTLYFDLLKGMVTEEQDSSHPKVAAVVQAVLENWRHGEKTLVFCFRSNTAKRLKEIVHERIKQELHARRAKCLGSPEALRALRARITGRDRDLIPLVLDRVLLSFFYATPFMQRGPIAMADAFALEDEDFNVIAELAIKHGVDLKGERVDRVFLNRAMECAVARRLKRLEGLTSMWSDLLDRVALGAWVERPYGEEAHQEAEGEGEDEVAVDERGVHAVYEVAVPRPRENLVVELAEALRDRHRRARENSVFDTYLNMPSLWFGSHPSDLGSDQVCRTIHQWLQAVTPAEGAGGHRSWGERMQLLQALRRVLLRESVLLRILPETSEREELGWGELLTQRFFTPLPGQNESMADMTSSFLEDFVSASGSIEEEGSARHALYEATRLGSQQYVALVSGDTPADTRNRVFQGFNTPLQPEVLICTAVGQEGIDLHRYCRHVVHYDLAWNPAIMEQRTGRTDRIGCKALRERKSLMSEDIFLEVGVPFLAGTYDERMFEQLRLRAQTFEVLTGGDMAGENAEGDDSDEGSADASFGSSLTPLPDVMLRDLRVRLHVWEAA